MAGINVFEVFAKIGLDTKEYEKSLGDSESKTSSFASKIGSQLKTVGKIGIDTSEYEKSLGNSESKTISFASKIDSELEAATESGTESLDSFDTSEYEKKISDCENKTSSFASKIGDGLKKAAKIGAAAIGAVATGVGALAKQSVEAYAEYEQLIGGVDTLFGYTEQSYWDYVDSVTKGTELTKESLAKANEQWAELNKGAQLVKDNAAKAFQTAGLSANEYMSTVTSFSASLISSLSGDTAKAAEYADMAIVDMADNANKMGSSMESIQNALTYRAA